MKLAALTIVILASVFTSVSYASDQLDYSDALEAFNNAKAPDMKIMRKKLQPLAFAIEGNQRSKVITKKVMKSRLQLKELTDALGNTRIIDPDFTYNFNKEGTRYLELALDENGLRGEFNRSQHIMFEGDFTLSGSEECRQLATSSIICKSEMYLTNAIDMKTIIVYKPKK